MPREFEILNAKSLSSLDKPGRYNDGGNLYLVVRQLPTGEFSRRWVFRYARVPLTQALPRQPGDKRDRSSKYRGEHDIGLGTLRDVSLANARKRAAELRSMLAQGIDPLRHKREARAAEEAAIATEARRRVTFGHLVEEILKDKKEELGKKSVAQWELTLRKYCAPLLRKRVADIDAEAIKTVLRPLQRRVPETAARLKTRIKLILDIAKERGLRSGDNPAMAKTILLKLEKSENHHTAMAYQDLADFVTALRKRQDQSMAAIALEFTILTASRMAETIGARWSEIDFKNKVWTVPAERMKSGRAHAVPLSDRAVEILSKLAESKMSPFVFPGQRAGKPLSHASMDYLLRHDGIEVTVHGFRSSFRDWCGNETEFTHEVAEAALAHLVGDKAERAYRRSDALEKRRKLIQEWADFIE